MGGMCWGRGGWDVDFGADGDGDGDGCMRGFETGDETVGV